ncbi:SDR family oxidoreductase [Mycolicibacterium sp. P1-18]|uniref:SDR family oxidoreductase n=1 Tax=Mycolicibacterium sp. P1-18 TaxID=2024615 RepID=UPI0011F18065|nr:SDR family oxidoreductase [Mycolicibacterium sp. P1-18]KAA0100010.1 SDR family oxidoreductase [Mycolicibacterium sp. P1-18]
MTPVSVITGGAGGMGLATARIVGRTHAIVLCDVDEDRLDRAAAALERSGVAVTAVNCDVTDRTAVAEMFATAADLGPIVSVVHAAGVSPSMGDAEYVTRTNALGTLRVGEAFHAAAPVGSAIVNVASMAAYLVPEELVPLAAFPLALRDEEAFMGRLRSACDATPEASRSSFAYAVSKSFVKWYSASQAERFNGRGQRIVSVSPGSVDTEMGRLEERNGAGAIVTDFAVPRWGNAEEMAEMFAFCAGDGAGYLTGTDILVDGGVVASVRERARVAAERAQSASS